MAATAGDQPIRRACNDRIASLIFRRGRIERSVRSAYEGCLARGKFDVVVFKAREQVAISVERHLNRAVPEQSLQPLSGKALFN